MGVSSGVKEDIVVEGRTVGVFGSGGIGGVVVGTIVVIVIGGSRGRVRRGEKEPEERKGTEE